MSILGIVWLMGMAWGIGCYASLVTEIRRGERKLKDPLLFGFMVAVDLIAWPLNFFIWFFDASAIWHSLFGNDVEEVEGHFNQEVVPRPAAVPLPLPPRTEEPWNEPALLQDDLRVMLSHANKLGMDIHFRVLGSNIQVPLNDVITFHLVKR